MAEVAGDEDRATALRSEQGWLRGQIETCTGLGGRERHFADGSERARIAVGKAIRRAIERIAAADTVIGAELRAGVETGARCCYRTADYGTASQ